VAARACLDTALAVHAWIAFGRRPATEREIAEEIERLRSRRLSS
jgi:hypothetical protein